MVYDDTLQNMLDENSFPSEGQEMVRPSRDSFAYLVKVEVVQVCLS